jgi:superfamily II DNA or RNA helicase
MPTINLRDYQTDARQQVNRLLNAGRNPIYCAPTGCGKTVTACAIIADRVNIGQRVFILCPQEEIFLQWQVACVGFNLDAGYIDSNGVQGRNKKVYICMPMSLNNILSLLPEKFKPDVIVTDECHHSAADTWLNIYDFYSDAQRLGLSATPQRLDGKGFDNIYTDIVQTIDMHGAIDQGFLAKPLIIVPEQYNLKVPINNGDYDIYQQAEQLGKVQIIGDVINQYSNIFGGLPVIVACSTSEHADIMTKAFCEAGWKFEHIHSKLNKHERRRIIREIRQRKLNGLCTCQIGTEGLDIPGLYGLIWLRRTLSVTIYLQFIGRVLRPLDGKQYGIIIDPVGNTFIHGRPEMHREWKLTGRNEEPNTEESAPKMKICPVCSVMNAEENITCHICGYDFVLGEMQGSKKRKLPVMIDGKLIILDAEKLAERKEEIQAGLREQRKRQGSATATGEQKEPATIAQSEKVQILKNGLEQKKGLFADAIRNYL